MEKNSQNPFSPPTPLEAKVEEVDLDAAIQSSLDRAFYAATYGVIFLPGIGYLVSMFVLWRIKDRWSEFSESQRTRFYQTRLLNIIATIPISLFVLAVVGESVLGIQNSQLLRDLGIL